MMTYFIKSSDGRYIHNVFNKKIYDTLSNKPNTGYGFSAALRAFFILDSELIKMIDQNDVEINIEMIRLMRDSGLSHLSVIMFLKNYSDDLDTMFTKGTISVSQIYKHNKSLFPNKAIYIPRSQSFICNYETAIYFKMLDPNIIVTNEIDGFNKLKEAHYKFKPLLDKLLDREG